MYFYMAGMTKIYIGYTYKIAFEASYIQLEGRFFAYLFSYEI